MISELEMRAYEGFIARAASFDSPFALKGSFLTRQFCPNLSDRIPADLDWYCTQTFSDMEDAVKIFNIWLMSVCHTELKDSVQFERLDSENIHWENAEYAIYNYFATINTDIIAYIGDEQILFTVEISFNWPIAFEPVAINYQTAEGASFNLPKAAPLYIQLGWKMHQCVIDPRLKDFVDLYLLLAHDSINIQTAQKAISATKAELDIIKYHSYLLGLFQKFLAGDFGAIFQHYQYSLETWWTLWRGDRKQELLANYQDATSFSDLFQSYEIPFAVEDFWAVLFDRLQEKGFHHKLLAKL